MKLNMRTAVALFNGMSAIDANEKTEVEDKVRLKLAININVLRPYVEGYQKTRNAMVQRVANGKFDPVAATNIDVEDDKLLSEEIEGEVGLKRFAMSDFRLKDNKRITGQVLSMLAPLIKDFGEGVDD